jgi:hypothetical protein
MQAKTIYTPVRCWKATVKSRYSLLGRVVDPYRRTPRKEKREKEFDSNGVNES